VALIADARSRAAARSQRARRAMNYFERLVHRALARPAGKAEALPDPFEETGLLELEPPLPAARQEVIVRGSRGPRGTR
jgi:hypothetical protein